MRYTEKLLLLHESVAEAKALIHKLNASAMVPIKNVDFAAKLIDERLTSAEWKSPVFKALSSDKSSGKLFAAQQVDPTLGVFFIDINFAARRAGNVLGSFGKSIQGIIDLINSGKKLRSVPLYNVRTNKIEEGNHRVAALKHLGYRSIPVYLEGGWD